jgi:hypothetical protein
MKALSAAGFSEFDSEENPQEREQSLPEGGVGRR